MGTNELTEFLRHSLSQRAASLLIARSPEHAIKALEASGYVNLQDPRELEFLGKRYLWVSPENAKEVYDLAMQYGTGQITFFDEATHQPRWISPRYQGSAIVLVIAKGALRQVEDAGLPLRAATGIAMQLV